MRHFADGAAGWVRLTSERAHELGQRDAVLVGMEHSEADVHVLDPVDRDVPAAVDAEVALDVADGHCRLLAAVEADHTHALVVAERHDLRSPAADVHRPMRREAP